MNREKMARLQILFEKMVSDCADYVERRELKALYTEYIDHGRQSRRELKAINQ